MILNESLNLALHNHAKSHTCVKNILDLIDLIKLTLVKVKLPTQKCSSESLYVYDI